MRALRIVTAINHRERIGARISRQPLRQFFEFLDAEQARREWTLVHR